MAKDVIDIMDYANGQVFTTALAKGIQRVFITGCGDSYHAAVGAKLAFHQLAGLPCQAMPAMEFSRYQAGFLPPPVSGANLVIGVSVSGQVSRTVEAIRLARMAGAITVAITGNRNTDLARAAEYVLEAPLPPMANEGPGVIVPGTRSYIASLISLYQAAIHIGLGRGLLAENKSTMYQDILDRIPVAMAESITLNDDTMTKMANLWRDAENFVFCGAGPGYGTAMFSAAKILEASGDSASAQELEEWAHLEYFARCQNTPTIIISAANRDLDRALEIAVAAKTIGRRLALVVPDGSVLSKTEHRDLLLTTAGDVPESFYPLVASIPGMLFAEVRSRTIDETYFRGFTGGRNIEGGGGISRIRTSHQLQEIPR